KRTGSDPALALSQIFANSTAVVRAPASPNCAPGFTPAAGDARVMRVTVTPQAGLPMTLSPDQVIDSAPFAVSSETLQGLTPAQLIQVQGNVSQATMTTLTNSTDASNRLSSITLGNIGIAPATLTTLSVALTAVAGTVTVASTAGYPAYTGTLLIDDEVMTYTGRTATTFTGVARGEYGSVATVHGAGSIINNYVLISGSALAVGGRPTNPKIVATGAGNVGIGVANPGTALQVAGVISPSADNSYTLGDATHRFSDVYSMNAANNTSDIREKKEIQESDLGLDFITRLRPVSYSWKSGLDETRHYGLIAQETEQAVADTKSQPADSQKPVIVTYDKNSDRYGIRYTELIAPVIKAIQEIYAKFIIQEAKIQAQDRGIASVMAENEKLKQENAEIKARLEKIERALGSK
ncbi:MAG: tail fiber domain-containing protein, partial [Bdellovibrionota bacterium]